jgi:undecaprenyl-diphosphatase
MTTFSRRGHGIDLRTQPITGEVRSAASRLVPSALALWGLLAALGFVLTHWLKRSAVSRWDLSVDRWFVRERSGTWNGATQVGSHLAETLTVVALLVVLFVVLRIVLGRWRESVFLAVAVIGEVTIFVCTTLVIDRARPAVPHLDGAPPTSSYPSGHTAAAIALYGGLAVVVWLRSRVAWQRAGAGLLAVCVPIVVALSRVYRGMHYPTDVLGGALLGVLWLSATTVVLMRDQR